MKHSGKASSTIHVWQKHEITLKAEKTYSNPYTEVELWVDLKGPVGGASAAVVMHRSLHVEDGLIQSQVNAILEASDVGLLP